MSPPLSRFATDAGNRYFEDYVPGSVHATGEILVDEAEVLRFARAYDPQPFHTDPAAAAAGPFGGLIASGFHTGAMVMRLLVDHFLSAVAGMGSPGLDEVRWPRPVRPGDRLRVRVAVEEARRSRSKPDRGVVIAGVEARNQHGEPVMTFRATLFVACRH
ncbi:MAG: MaoC family dehydratase [Porticoccaceae bacterium]|nr:MaoC family dehydratase [Porticoccaceae bacterium]MEA3301126.1 MaoC family dehydratase [Pseudomonadota bacterium]HLS98504.1 MaoC family dehydratase [Porticoccaceae bacterium]